MIFRHLVLFAFPCLFGALCLWGCSPGDEDALAGERFDNPEGVPLEGEACYVVLQEFVGGAPGAPTNGSQNPVFEECEEGEVAAGGGGVSNPSDIYIYIYMCVYGCLGLGCARCARAPWS